jgi:hypothetical protein
LPVEWRLVGNGRGDVSHLDFRRYVHDVLAEFGPKPDPERWMAFADNLYFAGGGFATDDPGSMLDVVADVRNGIGHDTQLVHYPAVPPSAFQPLTEALAQHDLTDNARIVYEKPFGTSPEGFRGLDEAVHRVVDESQVYRIDHFLGKEATQDLHVLRFANKLFEASWSREHVKAVQIDVPETLDIADRAGFYDATAGHDGADPLADGAHALNKAALLASDCGLPDLARDLCWQHIDLYRAAARPLTVLQARHMLEPVLNLARLRLRSRHGEQALRLLTAMFQAVRSGTELLVDEHPAAGRPHRQPCRTPEAARMGMAAPTRGRHPGLGARLAMGRRGRPRSSSSRDRPALHGRPRSWPTTSTET